MKNKIYTTVFLAIIIALTLYMPLRLHHSLAAQNKGSKSAILSSTFYNDAFYYLTIADNYSKTGLSTYDGKHLTNGYNILWQNILNTALDNVSDKETEIRFTFILSLGLALAAYLILFLLLFKITESRLLSILTIFPGFFYLLFSPALGLHYAPWSIINGMESSLDVLLFTVILATGMMFIYGKLSKNAFYSVSSFLLAFLFLARYDEISLFAAFFLTIIIYEKNRKFKKLLYIGVIPVIFIVIILVHNQIAYGLTLPVSGLVKSHFTLNNLGHIIMSVATGRSSDYIAGEHLFARILPLLIPLIFIPIISRKIEKKFEDKNPRWITFLRILKYYVLFKSIYILFFVDIWQQGYWYFYNQVIIFNILLALTIKLYLPKITVNKIFYTLVIAVIIYFSHSYFLNYERNVLETGKLNKSNVERINYLLANALPTGKIIEMDDGIIAFSSNNECLSGFGLCLDKEGYNAYKNNNLLELAYKRGYRYLASINYFKKAENIPEKVLGFNDFAQVPFFAIGLKEKGKWKYSLVLKDKKTNLIVVEFNKK